MEPKWAIQEAERLHKRAREKGEIVFETGFGPSGLPHLGTFGEVARTMMVRAAFAARFPDVKTRIICFSDDMDGLRKVPDNLPRRKMLEEHLGRPLSHVPDPFGDCHESLAAHNNALMQDFLSRFGFACEFKTASACYGEGVFNAALLKTLAAHESIRERVRSILGAERQATYSPFMPISPESGRVLMEAHVKPESAETIAYHDEASGERGSLPVTNGHCKLQWRADWAMRWSVFGVDYEMAGKDLAESAGIAKAICRTLKAAPPEVFIYELFLDEKGEKISKSRGNGLSLEEWLRYGPPESLTHFMGRAPRKAHRLHFDVIPREADDLIREGGAVSPVPFSQLLMLASACHAPSSEVLWGFVKAAAPEANPQDHPFLNRLVGHALAYYEDFIKPHKTYRKPDKKESAALKALVDALGDLDPQADAQTIQNTAYAVGKTHGYEDDLRGWFKMLYETLLGAGAGSRFGSFAALYGLKNTLQLIEEARERETG